MAETPIDLPETIKLTPSKKKNLLLLSACLAFVLIGIATIDKERNVAWMCISFFGLGVIIAVIQLLPGCTYLLITPQNFTTCTLFRKETYAWRDIKDFRAGSIANNKMVFLNFADNYDKSKLGRKIAKGMTGIEGALPDTYGLSAGELADLMSLYKQQHKQQETAV